MSSMHVGRAGVVRELTEIYVGLDGVVKPLKEIWTSVNGVKRQIFSTMRTWQKWSADFAGYQFTYENESYVSFKIYEPEADTYDVYYLAGSTIYTPLNLVDTVFPDIPSPILEIWEQKDSFVKTTLNVTRQISKSGYYIFNDVENVPPTSVFRCNPIFLQQGWSLELKSSSQYQTSYTIKKPTLDKTRTKYVTANKAYKKGSTNYGTVTDIWGTYPDNGYQDGYWWVLVE